MALIQPRTPRDTSASRLAEQRIHEWALHLEAERRRHEDVSTRDVARADSSLHCHFAGSWGRWCGGRPACGRTAQLGSPGPRDPRSHGRQVQVASRHAGSGRRVHIELDCGDFWQVARSAAGHALRVHRASRASSCCWRHSTPARSSWDAAHSSSCRWIAGSPSISWHRWPCVSNEFARSATVRKPRHDDTFATRTRLAAISSRATSTTKSATRICTIWSSTALTPAWKLPRN